MKSAGQNLLRFLFMLGILALAVCFHEPIQQKWHEITKENRQQKAAAEGPEVGRLAIKDPEAWPSTGQQEGFYYAYTQLSREEQTVYDQLLSGVTAMEPEVEVSATDTETVDRCYTAIQADHPELFWIGGYTVTSYLWGDTVRALKVEPEYLYPAEEKEARSLQIKEKADQILEETRTLYNNEYNRVKHIYEYIINSVDYDPEAPDNQNICSTFLYSRSVCMGYAKSFQYLLQQLGISCTTISGTADGEAHAWNLVRMDGEYYYADPTWGDSNFTNPEEDRSDINYLFLGMTTEDLEKTHKSNMEMKLPDCKATACNYYVEEGLLFEEFDQKIIGGLIWDSLEAKKSFCTFRFSDREAYLQAKKHLIQENKVFDYCQNRSDIRYRDEEMYRTITIYY